MLHFAGTRLRPRTHQNGNFRQAQGDVFDKHRIGKGLERAQLGNRGARLLQAGDIIGVIAQHLRVIRITDVLGAQTIDNAARRQARDRASKFIG